MSSSARRVPFLFSLAALIGILAICLQITQAQVSVSMSVKLNGQLVDFSGAMGIGAALYGDGQQELALYSAVPTNFQDKLPDGLALALKKETVKDLKAELIAVKNAVYQAQTLDQLISMLQQVAPETMDLLKQLGTVLANIYQQWKSALGPQEKEYVQKLEQLLQQKYNDTLLQIKQKYAALDAQSKLQLQNALVALVGPAMQTVLNLPVVKAQLARK